MRPTRAGSVRVGLAALAGLLVFLSFPGQDLWPAALLGVGLITALVRDCRPRRAAGLGLVFGVAYLGPLLHWSGIYVGKLPWFTLTLLEALYVAGSFALMPWVWALGERVARRAPLLGDGLVVVGVAGLWVLQEAIRGRWPWGGLPWGRLAFGQTTGPLLGLASVAGAPLLTAATAAAGAALAVAVRHALSTARPYRLPAPSVLRAASAGGAAALLATGPLLLPRLPAAPGPAASDAITVAAVQGDVPQAGLDFNAQRAAVLNNHLRGTAEVARRTATGTAKPDVVVWPENSSDIDPLRNADAYTAINAAAALVGVPVLVGAVLEEPKDHLSNAAILWGPPGGPGGGPTLRYVKRHPAPFAEYIPLRSFVRMFNSNVDRVSRDFVAGHDLTVMPVGPARLGAVICFEVAYDPMVRDQVQAGADVLVVQTNNATFGYSDESVQQLAMSRLRAVEHARSVVHVSTVGVSALFGPDGSVLAQSGHFTHEILQGRLPLNRQETLATRLGETPEWGMAAAGLLLALIGLGRRRSGESGTTEATSELIRATA